MRSLIAAVVCVLVSIASYSQNWQQATIIFHNGDSLMGEIDFVDWSISPSFIQFRSNGQVRSYDQTELNSFTVTGTQRYKLVRARLRYYNTVPVTAGGSPIDHEDSVAVYSEVLYSNPNLALYSLQDSWEDERLFLIKDGVVRELVHFTVTFDRGGQNYNQENNSYREQLKALLKDCDVAVNSSLVYSPRAIVPLLRKYSSCRGYASTVEKHEKKGLINIGVYAGGAGFKVFDFPLLKTTKIAGFDIQVLSKRNHNNVFIWLEAGYLFSSFEYPDNLLRPFALGLYGGRYFGQGKVQPLIFTGLSSINRVFDTGAGIALSKRVILVGSFSGLYTLVALNEDKQFEVIYSFKLKFYPRLRF